MDNITAEPAKNIMPGSWFRYSGNVQWRLAISVEKTSNGRLRVKYRLGGKGLVMDMTTRPECELEFLSGYIGGEMDKQQPAKPKPSEYGYDQINGWPDAETMERYVADLRRWFDSPNEGDFERMERTQEQAARAADEAEQNLDAEEPFGEHWQKLMLCHSKHDLIFILKAALEREAKLKLYLKNQ